ncbi:hypothetical protein SOVF_106250 [Spinacia oleracea]|uniref:Epidermal patterning factor-like protein n=1 Tax=Spinacia oleracea TaxID=3562 RepID=A0A9R0J7H8_SPIOL|nr:EPIDERMAL PATTERNING FACTOR-like protein 6 [Spinacia oleracea]KNA14577.1 hypothetical protein SOVF_106250 [Spinacia oleracea]
MRRSRLFICIVVLLVQIVGWVPATSRVLIPNHDTSSQLSGIGGVSETSQQAPYSSIQDSKKTSEAESYRGMNELGSRPPDCDHKCYGCNPCVAIQVPTISGGHLGIQFANYEPISWKCKCGASFYSP